MTDVTHEEKVELVSLAEALIDGWGLPTGFETFEEAKAAAIERMRALLDRIDGSTDVRVPRAPLHMAAVFARSVVDTIGGSEQAPATSATITRFADAFDAAARGERVEEWPS